jgi:hypothetical protein
MDPYNPSGTVKFHMFRVLVLEKHKKPTLRTQAAG